VEIKQSDTITGFIWKRKM